MLAVQVPIFPPLQKASDYTPAACSAMVRAALGIADPAFEIDVRSIRGWAMTAQVFACTSPLSPCCFEIRNAEPADRLMVVSLNSQDMHIPVQGTFAALSNRVSIRLPGWRSHQERIGCLAQKGVSAYSKGFLCVTGGGAVFTRSCATGGRRGSPFPSRRRLRHEHGHPGRPQPRLEARCRFARSERELWRLLLLRLLSECPQSAELSAYAYGETHLVRTQLNCQHITIARLPVVPDSQRM